MPSPPGVLVVDDNPDVLTLLDAVLQRAGFCVWSAPDGPAGARAFLEYRAEIDVVLLDVQMPGWDGPRTLQAVRAVDATVPCCFMSGDTGRHTRDALLGLGATAVFPKPFDITTLAESLRELAARSASRRGASHTEA